MNRRQVLGLIIALVVFGQRAEAETPANTSPSLRFLVPGSLTSQ
jgi:hypothetical protein